MAFKSVYGVDGKLCGGTTDLSNISVLRATDFHCQYRLTSSIPCDCFIDISWSDRFKSSVTTDLIFDAIANIEELN